MRRYHKDLIGHETFRRWKSGGRKGRQLLFTEYFGRDPHASGSPATVLHVERRVRQIRSVRALLVSHFWVLLLLWDRSLTDRSGLPVFARSRTQRVGPS